MDNKKFHAVYGHVIYSTGWCPMCKDEVGDRVTESEELAQSLRGIWASKLERDRKTKEWQIKQHYGRKVRPRGSLFDKRTPIEI